MPCNHSVQFFESPASQLSSLQAFVTEGLQNDESVIVIAIEDTLAALESRLRAQGLDPVAARWTGRYVPVDAEFLLTKLMYDGMPSESAFHIELSALMRLTGSRRKVRGYGEMVDILYRRGNHDALVRLEQLWTSYCEANDMRLHCGYSAEIFAARDQGFVQRICELHEQVIGPAPMFDDVMVAGRVA